MKRKTYIRGLHALPDGMTAEMFDWGPRLLDRTEVNAMWEEWRAKKAAIENDWRQDAAKRLAVATAEVEQDKKQLLVLAEWDRREQFFKKDAEETTAYIAKLMAFEDKLWKQKALAKVKRVGERIKKSDTAAAKKAVRDKLERLGKPVRRALVIQ